MLFVHQWVRRATAEHQRYRFLLGSLVVLLLAFPVMKQLGYTRFWSLVFLAQLLMSVYAVSEGRRSLMIALALVAPAIAANLSFFFLETTGSQIFWVLSVWLFLGYVASVVYKSSVFGPGKITSDRIAGAISVYLLMGILWSVAYGLIAEIDPGAFSGVLSVASDGAGSLRDFAYFSFVTLTTLGYGDALPVNPLARTLAWMEAVFGQLFVAITIARLVSLQISQAAPPVPGD
jgi:hypothetical protein